jgi:hypothetical protein
MIFSVIATANTAQAQSSHYSFDFKKIIFAEDNATGYRALTSMEPRAGDDMPLSNASSYTQTRMAQQPLPRGLDVSYMVEEGPSLRNESTTFMLHTSIPIAP